MPPVLGYGTNIHAGATLTQTLDELGRHAPRVRELVNAAADAATDAAAGAPLPIGLWLSARSVAALNEGGERVKSAGLDPGSPVESLRDWFTSRGLEVFTFNAFPYGDFHGTTVKRAVYEPHWGDARRLLYTLDIAQLAVQLCPAGTSDISISTLPLGWRATLPGKSEAAALGVATANLQSVVRRLAALEERTGVCVHLDLEPEPGCMLDRAEDVVSLFAAILKTDAAIPGLPRERREALVRRHLRVCHDICHSAVMFEDQAIALDTYRRAGISIGKVQVSAAIECDGSERAFRWLHHFDEPRWLHQTCVMDGSGRVHFYEDLGQAIEDAPDGLWRSHFHVPVFSDELVPDGAVRSTRAEIESCLRAIRPSDRIAAYEVETYAWSALPVGVRRATLAEDVAAELAWTSDAMAAAGLQPVRPSRG
ncbi:MAG: metabolite traffic protein EboE [Planctomycetota bacterium]|nr:metabolite traffic protein EboE [Planctomycetota bacterium]MDA1105434.1 metabolite traffic protein EboE [Planctomycetota bacterium]